jgi:hypothetical protein
MVRGCPRVAQKVMKTATFDFFLSTIEKLVNAHEV